MLLAAFRVRSFRFQWPADLLTQCAFEMETLILGWYVMVNTGSVLLLTAFGSLQFLGTLAAPMFGVLGDALGGRVMLCAMRSVYAVLAALLMVLALAGVLTPMWVFVIAGLVGETIPPADLIGALGLSRASVDSARVAGALTGAGLSTMLGIGYAYVVVTAVYLASLVLTFGISGARLMDDPGAVTRGSGSFTLRASTWRDLKDGLVHVLTTPTLLALMWLAFLVNLTAYPVTSGLLPYVARSVYRVDATGLGWLAASFSLGGLLGSMITVMTGGPRRPERSMLVNTVIWYALLFGFGHVPGMTAAVPTLLLAGLVQSMAMISMTGTLLAVAGDRFRARVMGVRMLAVYGMTVGLIGSGALIERVGYSLTISAFCTVGLLFTLIIGIRWRDSMWQRKPALPTAPPSIAS